MRTFWSLTVLIVMLLVFPASAVAGPATKVFVRASDVNTGLPPTAGHEYTFFISPRDEANAFDPSFAGTVHFTSSDAQAVLPADVAINPLHQVSNGYVFLATLKTAGPQTITATEADGAGSITGTSAPTSVVAAAATHLTIAVPAQAKPGIPLTFSVTARDQFGNRAPTYGGTVHFTSSDPNATLPADAQLTQGAKAFTATLRPSGNQTITATDTVAGGAPFEATGGIPMAGPVTQFEVIGPASAIAGFPALVGVRALDGGGKFADWFTGTVHFASSDGHAELPADVALVDGEAIVFATFLTPGTQTLTATDAAQPAVAGTSDRVFVGVLPLPPSSPPPPPPPPPPPAPAIGGLAVKSLCVSHARLLSASGRRTLTASFSVNVAARVTVTLQRLVHAAAPARCPRKAGSAKGAVKLVRTSTSSVGGGRATMPLASSAAIAKALKPGAYLVQLRATDAGGHRSALATAKFFVLR